MIEHHTVIDTPSQSDGGPVDVEREGFVTLHLRNGRVMLCPRLLTGQHLTTLLNVPYVILSRVALLGNGRLLRISREIRRDNTLHHLSNYTCLLLADHEWFGHIEQPRSVL